MARASLAAPVAESGLMCWVFSYNIPSEFSLPGFTMFFQKRQGGRAGGRGGCAVPGYTKHRPESRLRPATTAMAGLCLAGTVLVTAGCDDRVLVTGAGYQYMKGYFEDPPPPPPPSPIRPLSNSNPDYPTLYTVPMRPTTIPTDAERKTALGEQQKAVDALDADRRSGHSADELLQEAAPPPLPVPPAPAGATPGGTPGPTAGAAPAGAVAGPVTPAAPPK